MNAAVRYFFIGNITAAAIEVYAAVLFFNVSYVCKASIAVYSVDSQTGQLSHVQLVDGLVNPSFLVISKQQSFLYCVHGDTVQASALSISADGTLSYLNSQNTYGHTAAHLAISPDVAFLVLSKH
ncbi:hypothetical protein PS906_05308 [Pseudomonas fluorescens]|nr:hypothetical protein PS906_05308 [Pseudomonas fluorescens]